MEITQSADKITIINKNTYALVAPLIGASMGLFIVVLWMASSLSKTDILNVDPLTGLIGVFFFIACGLLAYGADERTTQLTRNGSCEVITRRRISGKTFNQTFTNSDVVKVEFVHGFTEKTWGNMRRSSSIYLVLANSDKIEILMRYAIQPLTFPFQRNQPLTEEANVVANFLGVPLETVDITTVQGGIQNFKAAITPSLSDRTRVLVQPPAQEEPNQTDKE